MEKGEEKRVDNGDKQQHHHPHHRTLYFQNYLIRFEYEKY